MKRYELRRAIRNHARFVNYAYFRPSVYEVGAMLEFIAQEVYNRWPQVNEKTRMIENVSRSGLRHITMPDPTRLLACDCEYDHLFHYISMQFTPKQLLCVYGADENDLLDPPNWLHREIDAGGHITLIAFEMRFYVDYNPDADILITWHPE